MIGQLFDSRLLHWKNSKGKSVQAKLKSVLEKTLAWPNFEELWKLWREGKGELPKNWSAGDAAALKYCPAANVAVERSFSTHKSMLADTFWLRKTSQKWWFAIVSMTEISQIWIKVALKGFKLCFLTVLDCFRGKIVKIFLHIFYIFCIFGYIFWVFRLHIYSIFWSKMLHIFPGPNYYW